MESYEEEENSQELCGDSQELDFPPTTSTERAVSRKRGRHEGNGGIFQYSSRLLASRRPGMERSTVSKLCDDDCIPPTDDRGPSRDMLTLEKPGDFFKGFIDDIMLFNSVTYTNIKIGKLRKKFKFSNVSWLHDITMEELQAHRTSHLLWCTAG